MRRRSKEKVEKLARARFRGNYVDWEGLPDEAKEPMLQISRELKEMFDSRRRIFKEPSCILPWSNTAFIYGGTEQKKIVGEVHEIKGHHEFNNMLNKIDCIIVLRIARARELG